MDLIWLDKDMREKGVLRDASFDGEVGGYYDFTLTVPKKYYADLAGGFVYPKGAFEFGGRLVSCESVSTNGYVTFTGKTWLGFLDLSSLAHISYVETSPQLSLDGYITQLLHYIGIEDFLIPDTGIILDEEPTTDDESKTMLQLLMDLFGQAEKVPTISSSYTNDKLRIILGARDPVYYNSQEFDSKYFPVGAVKNIQPYTYIGIICKYESGYSGLKQIYMRSNGTWVIGSGLRLGDFTGYQARYNLIEVDEETFVNPNWGEIIKELQIKDETSVSVSGTLKPDVGDYVTGVEETVGVTATVRVASKTLNIVNGVPIISINTEQGEY